MPDHPEPTLIPIPDDFPVTWDPPELQNLPLKHDRKHAPHQITPLTGWLGANAWSEGSSRGFERISQPLKFQVVRVNTYYYVAIFPAHPPEQMEAAGARAEVALKDLLGNYADVWDNDWLPKVKAILSYWADFDLDSASSEDLLDHMNGSFDKYADVWDYHMAITAPYLAAPSMFADIYMDLFEGAEQLDAYRLLEGEHNMSIECGEKLWDLARKYRSEPDVVAAVNSHDGPAALESLSGSEAGLSFRDDLDAYLDQYGHRADGILELAEPSWTEDPTPALIMLRACMSPDADDPREARRKLIEARDAAIAEARGKLAGYPEPVRGQFETFLEMARQGSRIQEDHNFWIDQQSLHYLRQLFMELGRRLVAADSLADAADVMYLLPDQITEGLRSGADMKATVAAEKLDMERWSSVSPPPNIGTDYGPPPPNPVAKAIGRFFGAPPAPSETPGVLNGAAGSPGKVTGTARVITHLHEAGRLNRGDVLVTITTAPPWTPLFAIAGAIVTDIGGPLSHCGIVAREYGLPGVLGTGVATQVIEDGQLIEVDGTAGVVRILD